MFRQSCNSFHQRVVHTYIHLQGNDGYFKLSRELVAGGARSYLYVWVLTDLLADFENDPNIPTVSPAALGQNKNQVSAKITKKKRASGRKNA
jgi:hypothetical protein